jgi:hypothetical protein
MGEGRATGTNICHAAAGGAFLSILATSLLALFILLDSSSSLGLRPLAEAMVAAAASAS